VQRMVGRGRDFNFDGFNHDGPLMPQKQENRLEPVLGLRTMGLPL